MGHRSAVCPAGRDSAPGTSGLGGADLQRVGSAAQSGQSILDVTLSGHIEVEGQGYRRIWSAAVDRAHTGRVLSVLVVCPLYSVCAAHKIGLPYGCRGIRGKPRIARRRAIIRLVWASAIDVPEGSST